MAIVTPIHLAKWTQDAGFVGDPWYAIVAIGIAQGANPSADGGVWGVGPKDDGPAQAKAAKAQWDSKGGAAGFPAGKSGAYKLFLPIALAVCKSVEVTETVTAPVQAVPDVLGGLGDAVHGIESSIANVGRLARFVGGFFSDPIQRQNLAVAIAGEVIIVVSVLQLLNRGVVAPAWNAVSRGFTHADNTALRAVQLNENVVKPYRAWRARKNASTP